MVKTTFNNVVDTVVESLLPVLQARTLRLMNEEWGERCPDFEPSCSCCQAWAFYDRYGVYPEARQIYSKNREG
jgi:hypothetical protein